MMNAKIVKISCQCDDVLSFTLHPEKEFDYKSGQFVMLEAVIFGKKVKRPYSIGSSPLSNDIELTVQRVPNGLFTTFLFESAKVGDEFEMSGPFGKFCYEDSMKDVVLIAAGSGIVPMMSIMRYAIT